MIQRILVPLELSAHCESAIRQACVLAKPVKAKVIGKVITDEPDSPKHSADHAPHAVAMLMAAQTERLNERETATRIQQLLSDFRAICGEAGVACDEAYLQGLPSSLIAEQSLFYDLVVHGFHGVYQSGDRAEKRQLRDVLDHTATPFVIVPTKFQPIRDVLICFDGSLSATRAMRDFAALIAGHDFNLTVLSASEEANRSRYLLNRAERYLKAHGASRVKLVRSTAPIREALRDESIPAPDLIVIGLHSKRGVRDFFIGSLTNELIESGETALFLGN